MVHGHDVVGGAGACDGVTLPAASWSKRSSWTLVVPSTPNWGRLVAAVVAVEPLPGQPAAALHAIQRH